MRYDLAAMVKRAKRTRRREILLRPITPTGVQATNLYSSSYAPIIALWTSALPGILADYTRTLSTLTTDSPEQIGSGIDAVERQANVLIVQLRLALGAWASTVEAWHRSRWRAGVLSATGVDIGTMIGPSDMRTTVGAAIERNVGLIRSVSDQARQRISQAVFDGLRARKSAEALGRDLREIVDLGRRRAKNIAADQTVKIASELNEERRREAGIQTWIWRSSHKLHFRPEHAARDGKRYSDDPADNRPPPADRCGQLPYCGCTEQACLTLDGEF